jgi:hypothetical protein
MKVITYGPKPPPKPPKSIAEQLCDELERRYSIRLLDDAIEILKARRARLLEAEVPQSETSAPAVDLADVVSKSIVETPTRRRPGRPKGTRKRRWTAERKEAHRLRKEKRIEEIRNNPVAQALMATLSGMTGARQGDGSEKPQVMTVDGQ